MSLPSLRRGARRGAVAAVLGLSVLSLSACAAGNDAQTNEIKPDNAAVSVGDIKIQNASVVTQAASDAKGPATVTARIFNSGTHAETLKSVTVVGSGEKAQLSAAKGGGSITVPAGGWVMLGGKNNASAVIKSGRESVQDGNSQAVAFEFSRAGKVQLRALVVPAKGSYADFGPTGGPSPSASNGSSPSGSASPGASGSPKSSGSPASPSAS
ncbi:DUF461 domain-containing protein [Streptomyces sp. NPDC059740]|uniref:DUF461 domain-containing protein n=1 Tax=Streptomyces sp. NPDC059740 TaxID=3346926 RepID=UPI00364C0735